MYQYVLADSNIANLALVNHLFKLLPRLIWVSREFFIENVVRVLLESNWPSVVVRKR